MASRKRKNSPYSISTISTISKTTHRAAYYFQEGSDGNNTWVFFLEGGGLCSHQDDCTSRSTTDLGSSKNFAKTIDLPSFQSSDSSSNPDWYAETKSQHSNVQENLTTPQTGTTPIKFLFRTVQEMYVVFALFNHISFSSFNYVTQITRISLVSLIDNTARKSLENQRSNANSIMTKT